MKQLKVNMEQLASWSKAKSPPPSQKLFQLLCCPDSFLVNMWIGLNLTLKKIREILLVCEKFHFTNSSLINYFVNVSVYSHKIRHLYKSRCDLSPVYFP